jgi:hypothetical protein
MEKPERKLVLENLNNNLRLLKKTLRFLKMKMENNLLFQNLVRK